MAQVRWARRAGVALAAVVVVVAVAACKPLPIGGAGAQIGNDPANCAQFQPALQAPCGPQPMVWAAIQGPYETFANGDPYATKCGRNLTASVAACSSGAYARGATNELYDPTGYEYAVEVGADDVGVPLAVEVYDAGSYGRTVGYPAFKSVTVSMTEGSATLNRTSGSSFAASDVGRPISGTGIPVGATVVDYLTGNAVTISVAATSTGTGRSVLVTTSSPDCNIAAAPFNAAPYTSVSIVGQNCQTGDTSSTIPTQFQLFDDDGDDLKVGYDSPIDGCELYVAPGAQPALYENAWAPVCTFVPARAGIYPLRVKSSAIVRPDGTAVADQGSGYNNFSLRVGGGTDTKLYALDALSIWLNTPATTAQVYLAEVTTADAGKRLRVDLFDPGDGASGQYTLQLLAPPAGAPAVAPTGGAVVPAAGLASSCRYNPTPSATRGPDVTGAGGADAANCQVVTRLSSSSTSIYNNGWLRIEVDIADDYTCDTDCWWTIRYDVGGSSGLPTDRTVWAPTIVDDPAPPA